MNFAEDSPYFVLDSSFFSFFLFGAPIIDIFWDYPNRTSKRGERSAFFCFSFQFWNLFFWATPSDVASSENTKYSGFTSCSLLRDHSLEDCI